MACWCGGFEAAGSSRPSGPAGKKPGVWALPKGLIGRGEKPEETALREVAEETGAQGRLVEKLGDVRYVYTWSGRADLQGRELLPPALLAGPSRRAAAGDRARGGRGALAARWKSGPKLLAYGGERDMAARALASLHDGAL